MENVNNEIKKDKNKNRIIVLVLGVVTVLIALIGATFAYFTSAINNKNGNESVTITTTKVAGLVYTSSAPIVIENAEPNASASASFTIENPNQTASITYSLMFVPDLDTFENKDSENEKAEVQNNQLLVKVSGGGLTNTLTLDYTDGANADSKEIITDTDLAGGVTDTYQITLQFVDNNENQNYNMGKTFVGHVEVTQSNITTPVAP